jgi:SAM-dependent methyltransferase
MLSSDMDLHGQALLDYLQGETETYVLLHRDDGFTYQPIPAKSWFYQEGFPEFDQVALARCDGRVLDLGAAAGSHALVLQAKGVDVIAVDLSPKAVAVMKARGVKKARIGDVYDTYNSRFDTVLILCNIGIVQSLAGLDRFLHHLPSLLAPHGQLLADSIDPSNPTDEMYQRYIKQKAAKGHYFGERTLRFEYKGQMSEWFEWIHIDPETLEKHAKQAGLGFDIVVRDNRRYLCSIRRLA